MLSEHPEIEKRLRQEIYEKVGQTGRPTYEQMRDMKYMRAFLNGTYSQLRIQWNLLLITFSAEVLRLYPPVLVFLSVFMRPNLRWYLCCSPVDSRYATWIYLPFSPVWYYLAFIGLRTKQSSFLLQTAVPNRFTSRHKRSMFFYFSLQRPYAFVYPLNWFSGFSTAFSSCIVEQTCGVLTVMITTCFEYLLSWLTYFLALVFDPDRFLDERVHKYLTPNPFIFCPFNAGPRICLGQQVCTELPMLYSTNGRNLKTFSFPLLSLLITKPPTSLSVSCSNSLDLL